MVVFIGGHTLDYHHKGECTTCGAWRPDGKPPTVHFTSCRSGPNGADIGPLAALPPSLQWQGGTRAEYHEHDGRTRPAAKVKVPAAPTRAAERERRYGGKAKRSGQKFNGHHDK